MDAGHLWGKTVWETEEHIKKAHQDPQIRVAAIGRAGENRVLYAAIVNDLHRAAGRSGVGAVMGSKNLKAVAVRGTRTDAFQLANPEAFFAATEAGKKALAANGVTGQGLPTYGTQVLMNVINELGALPTRNHRDVQFEGAAAISGEAMHQKRPTDGKANLVTNGACFGCTIACGRISRMDPGHFSVKDKPQYQGASGGLEYEAAWALGAANGVSDLGGPHLRQLPLQRGWLRSDLVRRHRRRGDGTLRPGHPDEGGRRLRAAVRIHGGPGDSSPK